MAENVLKARQVQKHDTEANWITAGTNGFIPKKGEIIIYDKDSTHTTIRIKIGDGSSNVSSLPFLLDGYATEDQVENVSLTWNTY
jgi:hypothetical protein